MKVPSDKDKEINSVGLKEKAKVNFRFPNQL